MNKKYTIGDYEYSEWTVVLGSLMLVAGIIYGIRTRKTLIGTVLIAAIASATGFSIGILIKAPKRINE